MPHRIRPSAVLRVLLGALLALGTCVQPVLAAVCEIADVAGSGGSPGHVVVAAHGDASAMGDGNPAQDTCCPNQACGDCCLHATASFTAAWTSLPGVPASVLVSRPLPGDVPSDYPVDIRPPIQG